MRERRRQRTGIANLNGIATSADGAKIYVTFTGPAKDQGGILDPAHIADQFWMLHTQPRDAWTFELDLRPWMESW